MPSPRTYHPSYQPRPDALCYVTAAVRPQLIHDASYEAALARAQRAAPGASAVGGMAATDWRQGKLSHASHHKATLTDRILAYLDSKAVAVTYAGLRDRLGTSAATIAGGLAREGRIQRRRYTASARGCRVSEYLAPGLEWPPLPSGAWGVIYDHDGAPCVERRPVKVNALHLTPEPEEAAYA